MGINNSSDTNPTSILSFKIFRMNGSGYSLVGTYSGVPVTVGSGQTYIYIDYTRAPPLSPTNDSPAKVADESVALTGALSTPAQSGDSTNGFDDSISAPNLKDAISTSSQVPNIEGTPVSSAPSTRNTPTIWLIIGTAISLGLASAVTYGAVRHTK